MPTRILLMARELNLGGSERQMTEIARHLDRSRFEPRVGCFHPSGLRAEELQSAAIPVVHFPVYSYRSRGAIAGARQLVRYIRREQIALVHAFDYPLNVFAVPIARWCTDAVAVASQRSHRELMPKGYARFQRAIDRVAHAVVVNCEFLRRHLVDDEHISPDRIRVCYNGIDLSFFHPGRSARPPALAGAPLVIGVVCALRPEKGLPVLLDAFARVRTLCPGMKLAIIGSGPMLIALEAQAGELGISADVIFEPATSRVPAWLRAIDIFVLPSLSEAFSNALMEAMACGCCPVASNTGGNPELVRPGETGLLFERASAESLSATLRSLIENPVLRRKLAANSLRVITSSFSIQTAAQRMGDIYSDLLDRRSQPAVHGAQEWQPASSR